MRAGVRALVIGVLLALGPVGPAAGDDWSQFRGPHQDGAVAGAGVPDPGPIGLEVVWHRRLGSGYSSISVAGETAVTLYSDGESDFVTAFDAATGEERWRYRVAETYLGHDGSSDGPLSTPAIHGGVVYALGPKGQLLALTLDGGDVLWSHDLAAGEGSRVPMYGFAAAPVVTGDLLVVQSGGRGRSVTAFDRVSGELRWASHDDPASYQSPIVTELLGRRQLVAAGDYYLMGLEASTGEVLWQHRHTEDGKALGASAHLLRLDDDRLLVRPSPDEAVVYELSPSGEGVDVRELWRAPLQRSHSAAVLHEGHLYSFDTHFLVCLDAATGERRWKSRPPGGRGLIRVGSHLVVLGSKGHVVLARATPDRYRERARLRVFEHDGWTPPSFAGGRIFVRNLEEMASLRIVAATQDVSAAQRGVRGRLEELVRRIEGAPRPERQALVDAWMAEHDTFPVVDDGGFVHFVYRGEAEDVAVAGNFTEDFGEEVALTRIEGTHLFARSFALDPSGHYEYRFHVDFGGPRPDPRNPHGIGSMFGPSSELRMPGWTAPAALEEAVPRGRLSDVPWPGVEGRRLRVYLPPGYDASARRYPLLVVQEGEGGDTARLERILDGVIGPAVEPLVAVFLPRLEKEHDVAALERYRREVAEAVLPHLEQSYRLVPRGDRWAVLGAGSGAPIAAWLVFKTPGVFGKVALQSFFLKGLFGKLGAGAFSMTPDLREAILASIRESERQELDVYVEWSVRESADPSSGLDARADTERLLEALAARGYRVRRQEVRGAPGYGSWRARTPRILEAFYP